jgi:hypothetical protein
MISSIFRQRLLFADHLTGFSAPSEPITTICNGDRLGCAERHSPNLDVKPVDDGVLGKLLVELRNGNAA